MNGTEGLFKLAMKDETFIAQMKKGANNPVPSRWFSDVVERGIWSAAYYGYLVGREGIAHAEATLQRARLM